MADEGKKLLEMATQLIKGPHILTCDGNVYHCSLPIERCGECEHRVEGLTNEECIRRFSSGKA